MPVGVRALFEHDARGAVQLRDNDALGAIDHEGAQLGQERKLAEIDFLLDDVAGALAVPGILEDDQLQRGLERGRVRHVAFNTLRDRVLGLTEAVPNELQREILVDVRDREQVLENALEANILALLRGSIQLEQRLKGARLDVEQMGHIHARLELRERDLVHHILRGSPAYGAHRIRRDRRRKALRPRWSRSLFGDQLPRGGALQRRNCS